MAGAGTVITANFDLRRSAGKKSLAILVCPDDFDCQILARAETGLFQFIEECWIASSNDRIVT